jgi:hypothetical protein
MHTIIEIMNTIRLKRFSANCIDMGIFIAPRTSVIPKKTKNPITIPRIIPAIILNAEGRERISLIFLNCDVLD